jgi:hypothetical protein
MARMDSLMVHRVARVCPACEVTRAEADRQGQAIFRCVLGNTYPRKWIWCSSICVSRPLCRLISKLMVSAINDEL